MRRLSSHAPLRATEIHANQQHLADPVCARPPIPVPECDDVRCLALKAGLGARDGAGLGLGRERGTACCSRGPGAGRSVGGTWGSALTALEFAAIRGVGFEPVGQVFGAAVYPLTVTAAVGCPGTATPSLVPGASARVTGVPGPAAQIAQALNDGRWVAIDRMAGECSDLGGHGIVGASLQVTETPGDSFTAATVEFKVIGTAVRAKGCPPLSRPFTTELSGQDFAKLLMDGWVPAGIALGISVAGLHDILVTTSSGPWGTRNAEVPTYTGLMVYVRQDARSRLEQTVRGLGADGVVVSAMTLHVHSDACQAHPPGTDHFAEAVITGTAVARFADQRNTAWSPGLAVLPLDAGGDKQVR